MPANRVSAAEPTPCWELIQTSFIAGKHRIVFSPKAFRIESLGNRYVIVSKAPDWRVVTFNPRSKLVFASDLKGFKGQLASGTGAFGGYLEGLPLLKAPQKAAKLLGQPVMQVHIENPKPVMKTLDPKAHSISSSVFFDTGEILRADFWTWPNANVPKTLPIVLNRMYKMPPGTVMPLKLLTVSTEREAHLELDTSALKKVSYDEREYFIPPDLKAVKEDIAVVNDGRRQNAVKNLIQNWDGWGKIVETGN